MRDKFTLKCGISCHDDFGRWCQAVIVGFAFLRPDLTGDEREGVGDNREVVTDETAHAVAIGHGELDKVSECPCHGIAASLEISFTLSLSRPRCGRFHVPRRAFLQ